MLDSVKLALRITTEKFDTELQDDIDDCLLELAGLHVYHKERHLKNGEYDKQIQAAVIYYCKWKFGFNPDAERWEKIYHDKVEKLLARSGYGIDAADVTED